jgi:hypothetical protein
MVQLKVSMSNATGYFARRISVILSTLVYVSIVLLEYFASGGYPFFSTEFLFWVWALYVWHQLKKIHINEDQLGIRVKTRATLPTWFSYLALLTLALFVICVALFNFPK